MRGKKKTKGGSGFYENFGIELDKAIRKIPVLGTFWSIITIIIRWTYRSLTRSWVGVKDAIKLRPLRLAILTILSVALFFSTFSTTSFYSTCDKTEIKDRTIKGDYTQLSHLQEFELALEKAEAKKDQHSAERLESRIDELRFRNKFGRTGAKIGAFFCNGLFGFASLILFAGLFVILYYYAQRILFPAKYSLLYALSRSLLYGVFFLFGLTLWASILAQLLQINFGSMSHLLWGGDLGVTLHHFLNNTIGLWGVILFLLLLPMLYTLIFISIRVSPKERAIRKGKEEAEKEHKKKQEAKALKEKERVLAKEKKEAKKEHIKSLEEQEAERQRQEQERQAKIEEEARLKREAEAEMARQKAIKECKNKEKRANALSKLGKTIKGLFSVGAGTIEQRAEALEAEELVQETEVQEPITEAPKQEVETPQPAPAPEEPKPAPAKTITSDSGIEIIDKRVVEEGPLADDIPQEEEIVRATYVMPHIDLLEEHGKHNEDLDQEVINKNAQAIIETLAKFRVEATVPNATVGPTITLYELRLGDGVRINSVSNLDDDIAMSLRVDKVRIIAPLPGRGTVGVEVPNPKAQTVSMRSMMSSNRFKEAKAKMQLPVAIGKTITNETFVFDLAKTPHLLIAGATGQGKSVGLNAMITSLLYSKTPDELKLVMVDPKMLEFAVYEGLDDYFLTKNPNDDKAIITDMTRVMPTLKSLCQEMDERYYRLSDAGVRNIIEYNQHIKAGQLNKADGHKFLPYIVVIIDEFADLMMTARSAKREVETLISRLAQKARAAGIHLVMATQRPSTDVITGLIKANFPSRIAFRVFSDIDSRTILGGQGAEQLVGRGDMLFYAGQTPQRVQCAFIDTPETEAIVNYIQEQPKPLETFTLPECEEEGDDLDVASTLTKIDPMLKEIARTVVETRVGSTSNIQRRFEVGYNKAGRIMDQMQALGIVGPQMGSKPREILVADLIELDQLFIEKGI